MIHADKVIAIIAAIGSLGASAYYLLVLWSARSYLKTRSANKSAAGAAASFLPPGSILKPLKGVDPEIYESFRSHCLQDYPQYEIIFGVSDANDPAVHVVERVRQEFPQRAIQ